MCHKNDCANRRKVIKSNLIINATGVSCSAYIHARTLGEGILRAVAHKHTIFSFKNT